VIGGAIGAAKVAGKYVRKRAKSAKKRSKIAKKIQSGIVKKARARRSSAKKAAHLVKGSLAARKHMAKLRKMVKK
jgi:hypothetical protein